MSQSIQRVLVGQSGGPTAVINASLAGVLDACTQNNIRCLGMRYGIEGFLKGRVIDLAELSEGSGYDSFRRSQQLRDQLATTPSSWLGSCRYKLPDPDSEDAQTVFEEIFDGFDQLQVDAMFYIGGNDSMDTIEKLARYGAQHNSNMRFIGIPKTIDNDLVSCDHTPGYASAAKFAINACISLVRDANVYTTKNVILVEFMGRETGWLTASACFADADLILLPEAPVRVDTVCARVNELFESQNTVLIAVSEGTRTTDGRLLLELGAGAAEKDAFNNAASLSGASRVLAQIIKHELGCKTRAVELSTLQRCAGFCMSATDLKEARMLGEHAVQSVLSGANASICALSRVEPAQSFAASYQAESCLVPATEVANKTRSYPQEWISVDGMGVTDEFMHYLAPLLADEPELIYDQGILRYLQAL